MIKVLATVAAALLCTSVFAADNQLGTSSTHSLSAAIKVDMLVKVAGLGDIDLGTYVPGSSISANGNGCVYSNNGGTYTVTATARYNNAGTQFLLQRGATTDTIPLAVSWCTATNGSNCALLTHGSVLNGQTGAHTASVTCGGSNNVSIKVDVSEAAMGVPAGTYSGDVTILVSPE